MLRGRFKAHHELCLKGIAKVPGFSGTITPGESLGAGEGAPGLAATAVAPHGSGDKDSPAGAAEIESETVELEQEAEDEDEEQEFSRDLLDVLTVSMDSVIL
jgi:hypothetical protein